MARGTEDLDTDLDTTALMGIFIMSETESDSEELDPEDDELEPEDDLV